MHRLRSALAAAALGASCCAAMEPASPSPPAAAERVIALEVVVNGAKSGTWPLLERGGVLYAPRDAFEEWRLQLNTAAAPVTYKGQEYLPLSAVAGFKARIDHANQSVELLFSPEAFSAQRLGGGGAVRAAVSPVLPSVFLNYDASLTSSKFREGPSTQDLGVISELGLSHSLGVLTTSQLARNLTDNRALGVPRVVLRLETTLTRDFPAQNRTLRIGDTTTRAGMWGRNVYFGGIQYGSNFAFTPGFVRQPLPTISGLSAAPSTVELYVNDVLRQVSSVPTGPFAIDNFPVLSGNGEARLVVRDVLGRETVIVQSFFTNANLLAPGLDDWSAEAGSVRRDLGSANAHYGPAFASGTWRRGLTKALTLEGRAEVTRQTQVLGVGAVGALPGQILGQAAVVASRDQTLGGGSHWLVGLERQWLRGSTSVQAQGASAHFRQLGQELEVRPIKLQLAGNATYATEGFGTLGLGFASISSYDRERVSTISGNYSLRVGQKSSLSVTMSRAVAGASGTAFGLTLLVPLDDSRVASASANTRDGAQDLYVAASQTPGPDSDLGWRALAGRQQGEARAEGGVYYLGPRGTLSGDVSASRNVQAVRLGANGGIVGASNAVFFTRRVEDSFAIAEVAGYGDISIGLGSNRMARTNADGIALIPRLMPYTPNSLRIDPRELPISAEIDSIEQIAVPAWRSAVKVTFPVRTGRAALLRIVLDDGDVMPAGAIAKIDGQQEEFFVARRGEAFVTGLRDTETVGITWEGKRCLIEVKLPPGTPDQVPRLGPLLCKGVAR